MKAISYNNLNAVKLLLKSGVSLDRSQDKNANNCLMKATAVANINTLQFLIDQGVEINSTNKLGENCLMKAAEAGNLANYNYLIKMGAKVSSRDKEGNTLLIHSAAGGNIKTIEHLLKNGAKIEEKNRDGDTAISKAVEFGNFEAVKFLVKSASSLNEDLLPTAAYNGDMTIVKYLLEQKKLRTQIDDALLNACFADIYKPFKTEKIKVMKYLVEQGADINPKDDFKLNATPLSNASYLGNLEMVRYLIDKGAEIKVELKSFKKGFNEPPTSSLIAAVQNNKIDIVKILLEKGAEINSADMAGNTPLKAAKKVNNQAMIEFLIKERAK